MMKITHTLIALAIATAVATPVVASNKLTRVCNELADSVSTHYRVLSVYDENTLYLLLRAQNPDKSIIAALMHREMARAITTQPSAHRAATNVRSWCLTTGHSLGVIR